MDVDQQKIDKLKQGFIPIYEPGLDLLVRENYANGQLQFTTGLEEAVAHGDVHFIAVGTPSDEDGSADLRYVKAVAENIAMHMEDFKVVVTKSTVPIGTADIVRETIRAKFAATRQGAALRRGLQSGIPEGRLRDQRLPQARSHHRRHRQH